MDWHADPVRTLWRIRNIPTYEHISSPVIFYFETTEISENIICQIKRIIFMQKFIDTQKCFSDSSVNTAGFYVSNVREILS